MLKVKYLINSQGKRYPFFLFSIAFIFFAFVVFLYFVNNINKTGLTKTIVEYSVQKNHDFNNGLSKKDLLISTNIKNSNEVHDFLNHHTFSSVDLHLLPQKIKLTLDISGKKEEFITLLLPLIVYENEKISADRNRLLEIQKSLNINKTLNKGDLDFLEQLALNYQVTTDQKLKVNIISELLEHVDVIPNSITLAQAANESGWGLSRFAKEFNAFFGEYTFNVNNGIIPSYREEGKKHLIKFFPNINDSIQSYMKNINTHYAYKDFRKIRKLFRSKNLKLDIDSLVNTLSVYAEDQNYIENIKSIIRVNKLNTLNNINNISTNS